MKKIFSFLAILFLLLGSMAASLPADRQAGFLGEENILYFQDFNTGTAPEWVLEPGWEIKPSETGYALSGIGHVWARLNAGPWNDYFMRFRTRLEAGASLHANIRTSGPTRYFIGFYPGNISLSKQTGENDFKNGLAGAPGVTDGWHTVEISAVGGTITVLVDKLPRLRYADTDPLTSGGVAFESLGTGTVWVDDVQIGENQAPAKTSPPTPLPGDQPANPVKGLPTDLKWVRTGGPLGGLGYDVRMSPDNPDIMFVTDAKAGVFKSVDGGKTWQPSNQGITTRAGETGEIIPIFCLTIDQNNPNIVWAGTQSQRGIFKSTDRGKTWVEMDAGIIEKALILRGFTVDPRSSEIVYTAGEVSSWEWNNNQQKMGIEFDLTKGVVYKTTNGGKSWQKIWEGNNLARYIWIDPRNADVIYASTGIFDREAANSDPTTHTPGGVGVIKSIDGGKTWKEINQGLDNLYVGSLFMHPTNPNILLAGVGNNSYMQHAGVYLTTDGGASWKQTLDAYVITSVEISTSNPDIAYAGSFGEFYRSQDGGNTWQKVSPPDSGWGPPGILGGQPIDLQADPRSPDRLFANAYGGGNFLSEDGGKTWVDASQGYTGSMVRDILVDPTSPAHVIAAARSGIFSSWNSGQNWSGLANPPYVVNDWHTLSMDPRDPQKILADITCEKIIVYTRDGGTTWKNVNSATGRYAWHDFEFAPSNPDTVYAGSAGFYSCGQFDNSQPGIGIQVSHDGGLTWSDANDANSQDAAIYQLAVHPENDQIVFVATSNRGLLTTSDGGKSWQSISGDAFKGRNITAVKFFPDHPDWLLVGRDRGGLLRSEDGGKTWKLSSAGLNPEATVTALVFDPHVSRIIYLADLFSGVYRSTDNGKTWLAMNNGLLLRAINTLAISQDGQHLYGGSEGQGVFRLDLNGQPPEPAAAPTQPAPTLPQPSSTVEAGVTNPPASETTPAPSTPASKSPSIPLTCPSTLPLVVIGLGFGWGRLRRKKFGEK